MHYFLCFLSLLLKSGVSENLITIPVDLGQNVTLNCSLNDEHIFWYRQRQLEGPVYILNSLGKAYDFAEYNQQHKEFRKKYLLQTSRLFIHNLTCNELGSYYCARLKDHLIFSNGVALMRKGKSPWTPNYIILITLVLIIPGLIKSSKFKLCMWIK